MTQAEDSEREMNARTAELRREARNEAVEVTTEAQVVEEVVEEVTDAPEVPLTSWQKGQLTKKRNKEAREAAAAAAEASKASKKVVEDVRVHEVAEGAVLRARRPRESHN